jgi:hypothetical protein
MKNILSSMYRRAANSGTLLTVSCFLALQSSLMADPAIAEDPFAFGDGDLGSFGETGGALRLISRFAFYIMYLLGGVMLAASGFKLKAGDMQGFYKMAAGSVVVFLSPFLIEAMMNVGDSAGTIDGPAA